MKELKANMETLMKKVVWVVGGSSGIGLGIAQGLAGEGCQVILSARTEAGLSEAKTTFPDSQEVLVSVCDATKRDQVNQVVNHILQREGRIDILVYSAGMNIPKRKFSDMEPEDMGKVMDANAVGAFHCIQAVLPHMRERGNGWIVNVVSLAGLRALQLAGVPYCASKFAQSAIGTAANLEALPDGVSVTNVYPGETETPILEKRPVKPTAEQRAKMLQPSDIAAVVVAMAKLPPRATVPEIVITPRHMPLI